MKALLLAGALELAFLATAYSNLFFLLLAFCAALGALGLYWGVRNLAGISLETTDLPLAAADSPRPVRFVLRCNGARCRFDLGVELHVAGLRLPVAHLPLAAGTLVVDGTLPGLPRGVHAIAQACIVTRFPFGLWKVARRVASTAAIVTHPAPADADATAAPAAGGEPDGGPLPAGARSCEPAGLRPFRPGDSARDVNWKATARRGQPIVVEHERRAGDALHIVLDRRCSEDALERALSVATARVLAAAASGRAVLLHSQGTALAASAGQCRPTEVLRWLAAAAALPADAGPPPPGSRHALRLPHHAAPAVAHA